MIRRLTASIDIPTEFSAAVHNARLTVPQEGLHVADLESQKDFVNRALDHDCRRMPDKGSVTDSEP